MNVIERGYILQDYFSISGQIPRPSGELSVQQENSARGTLRIDVTSTIAIQPIEGAVIRVYNGTALVEELRADSSGQSEALTLAAPPPEYSMEPGQPQPYAAYTVRVEAEGYRPVEIEDVEVLPDELAIQPVQMQPLETSDGEGEEVIVVPPNTLLGDFPPKIAEDEIKPMNESGEIVLSRVVIPEYVVVHDGAPSDSTAKDYYVRYRDYIKNVASSEIYSTWPDAALRANILAIMSFTMNRVHTEYYRNRGYDYTVTSSTAYDQKWSYGRTIFSDISQIVDEMFNNYLSRPNVVQPILTQYCDGKQVSCPGWLSQWGSKYLADQGYRAIEILRYYYGSSLYINTSEEISGIPASWPGQNLTVGSTGTKVRQMQEQLAVISASYPAIPTITADGVYGERTKAAVEAFQRIFDLPVTGIVDFPTWYKISQIYVGVSRIAELN
ncbi:MAG: peptidoglycan-binding protein [Clostridiales bacterium]|nr:peptidoglycan-binding protein [Clostridiales bacterium]